MSENPAKCSGHFERLHAVKKCETVSGIAAKFRAQGWPVKSWEPIYDATRLKTGLWDRKGTHKQRYNPDLIYAGDVVIIPRSIYGYNRAINRIQQLGGALHNSANQAASNRENAIKFGDKIDLISDVLQLVITRGMQANAAVKAAKAAKSLTGAKLIEKLIEKHEALAELSLKIAGFAGTKAGELSSPKTGALAKGAKSSVDVGIAAYKMKALKGAKALALGVGSGAELVLDYVNPSTVAKLWIQFRTGEKVDDVLLKAELQETQSKTRVLKMLGDRVVALRAERDFLYNAGPVPSREGTL